MGKNKQSKQKYNMWQCAGYMVGLAWKEKEKKVLVLCMLQAILGVAANLINLYITPTILSVVERRESFFTLLITVLVFVSLTALCAASTAYVNSNALYGRVSVRTAIVSALNKKSCTTSYPNIEDEAFIRLRAKAGESIRGNDEAAEAVWGTLTTFLQNTLGFAVYIALLATLNLWLILVILATALTGYFVTKRLTGYGYRHREEEAEIAGRQWYNMMQTKNYAAAKDIRIFGMKPWMAEVSDKAVAAYQAFHKRANNVYIWGNILDFVLAFLRNGFAYVYLISLVVGGGLSVTAFLLYFAAVGGFSTWVSGILSSLTTLHRQSIDLSTVRECLEYPEPFSFDEGAPLPPRRPTPPTLQLENVWFKYPGAADYTLKNISLTLHPGEKIAVVGLNGAGKTTLVKLICGFLDPSEGSVLLDGQNIKAFNRREYYTLFSAVFQDFSLLAGTVATNVAQTEKDADIDRVRACVEKAGLRQTIEALPQGYQTYLNRQVYEDAAELSSGETQRLMLARALYKNAPFLLLDEPTAALDAIAEADMYNKYHEIAKGCSSVYISHRLASTRFCDRILLISGHEITEEGTHEALLKRGGAYAQLFSVQSKYYREGDLDEAEQAAFDKGSLAAE